MNEQDQAGNGVTRRRFAAMAICVPAVATLGEIHAAAAPQQQATFDFRNRSAQLTGFSVDDLDADLASALLRSLVASGRGDELRRLVAAPDAMARSALAADIVSAWYSGVHPGAAGPSVATYNDALMWPALGFAQPRGVCGVPGYWAARPVR